jgi:hypothetical protein
MIVALRADSVERTLRTPAGARYPSACSDTSSPTAYRALGLPLYPLSSNQWRLEMRTDDPDREVAAVDKMTQQPTPDKAVGAR